MFCLKFLAWCNMRTTYCCHLQEKQILIYCKPKSPWPFPRTLLCISYRCSRYEIAKVVRRELINVFVHWQCLRASGSVGFTTTKMKNDLTRPDCVSLNNDWEAEGKQWHRGEINSVRWNGQQWVDKQTTPTWNTTIIMFDDSWCGLQRTADNKDRSSKRKGFRKRREMENKRQSDRQSKRRLKTISFLAHVLRCQSELTNLQR